MKKTNTSHPVSEIVQRALDEIGKPYTEDITDKVCLTIERHWHNDYQHLVAEHGKRAVNSQIGRSVLQITRLKNLGTRAAASSKLIKTYTKLG